MSAIRQHIVLAGFGNMGRALAAGWRDASVDGRVITVVDPSPDAQAHAASLGLRAVASVGAIDAPIDIAVLAVKPAQIGDVLQGLPAASLYVSIAAGRTIAEIQRHAGANADAAVVRAMPNTPAAIGQGVTGLCASASATADQRAQAADLMSAVGLVEWLGSERDMDALTAVSGSGPAYVFLLIECLTAAGMDAGLEPELAARLATATIRGAGAYAAESGLDAAILRRQVTSPNGTTEAALKVLMEGDVLQRLVSAAVAAAARRSRELSSG
jgi:pyrroline-5-carboxylate reductase